MPSKEYLMKTMPRVGDQLVRRPHLHTSSFTGRPRPRACVVEYVNEEHLWYRVRFENGTSECFKAPYIPEPVQGGTAND